jgi:hypothetical protein
VKVLAVILPDGSRIQVVVSAAKQSPPALAIEPQVGRRFMLQDYAARAGSDGRRVLWPMRTSAG